MKKGWVLPFLCWIFFCNCASAQVSGSTRVNVRGQIYGPNGAPLQSNVRFQLSGEDGQRPPAYFVTDSKGSFILFDMEQGASYTLIVESDGKNWAATTERFYALGPRPFVSIHLRPLAGTRVTGDSISVAELRQNVPRGARNEYAAALENLSAGEVDRARKAFQRAIELFPDFVEARSELAVLLMRDGQLSEAEALLRRALEIDKAAARPTLNLGLCLYRQQRYADALPLLEHGVQLQPDNANAHLLLGITLAVSGEDTRAEPVLLRAYQQGGRSCARAQLYLSRLYTRQKNYARAADALEIYLRDLPDEPNAESLRATLAKLRAAAAP